MNTARILNPVKRAVRSVGFRNNETDGSSYFKTNIFSSFEEESIDSIQFDAKIINMTSPAKICMTS